MSELLLDRAGRHRSPATMPGFHVGRPPRNKGLRYPAVPPGGGDHRGHARRRRRRARLAVARLDRDPLACRAAHPRDARTRRGGSRSAPRRCGGPSRQGRTPPRSRHGRLGMDRASAVARERVELPVGPLVCVLTGPTRGRHWSSAAARTPYAARPWRPACDGASRPTSSGMPTPSSSRAKGVPLIVIERQLGHSKPRHYVDLPPGHRQRRDHRNRPCPPRADDPRKHIPTALT